MSEGTNRPAAGFSAAGPGGAAGGKGKLRLRVAAPWPAWSDDVRQGQLLRADGSAEAVLIRLHPEVSGEGAPLELLQRRAKILSRLRDPNILRVVYATAIGGQAAVVYEGFEGASLARITPLLAQHGRLLPLRALLEIGEVTARAVHSATGGAPEDVERVHHEGPQTSDLLIDAHGILKVTGFTVIFLGSEPPPSSSQCPPPEGGGAGGSWAIGALLVELLTGERMAAGAADPAKHEANLRRATTRVLARAADPVPEAVVQLIRATLSHDPRARPSIQDVADRLLDLSRGLSSTGLRSWAAGAIGGVLEGVSRSASSPPAASRVPMVDSSRPLMPDTDTGAFPVRTVGGPARLTDGSAQPPVYELFSAPTAPTLPPREAGPPALAPFVRAAAPGETAALPASSGPQASPRPPSSVPPVRSAVPPIRSLDETSAVRPPRPTEAVPSVPFTRLAPIEVTAAAPRPAPSAGRPMGSLPISVGTLGAPELSAVDDDYEHAPTSMVQDDQLTLAIAPSQPSSVLSSSSTGGPNGPSPSSGPALSARGGGPRAGGAGAISVRGPGGGGPVGIAIGAQAPLGSREEAAVGLELAADMSPPGADRRAPVPNPASGSPGLRLLVFFAVGVLITGALVVAWFVASPGVPEEEVQGLAPPASSLVGSGPPPSPASPAEQPLDADQALVDEAPPVAPAVAPASPAPAASAPSGKVSKPAAPSTSTRAATSPAAAAAPTPEDSEDAEDDVPARIERRAPSAEAAPTAEAAPSTAPASAGRFRLEFRAADPSVTRMEVRCHEGVSGQGGASVVLPEAVRGPCRVTGFQGDTPIVAFVTATGAQNFGCFEGGARTCR
jgi:hypothetical protein